MSRIHGPWQARMVALALAIAPGMLASVSHAAPQDLLVSSRLTDQVLRYDGITGAFLGEFVTAGSGGLDVPGGLTFGSDGNLYVAGGGSEPRVRRYDGATGAFVDDFTQAFPEQIFLVAFEADGNLYGNHGSFVFRVDGTTGAFLDDFVDLGLGELAVGFSFGPDGSFYVASFAGNQVLRFDGATGDFIDVLVHVAQPCDRMCRRGVRGCLPD